MAADPRANVKARLISSLFSTRGDDGTRSLLSKMWLTLAVEQYITHVKITEDSQNPATPPANGDSSNRKHRYIVVSVQKSGAVRLHKTRENTNGTFSIGKTWGIETLEKLEETDSLGFIITIQKPYYWMTETAKEKYSFVTAIIQVYRKFTGGKTPEILGFESIFRQPTGSQNSRRESPIDTPKPSNPYAALPPPSQSNPYAANPAAPYAANAAETAPVKARRPSQGSDQRPMERISSRQSDRSPERPRSRDRTNGIPVPVAPLNISRQATPLSNPSETSLASSYDSPASTRSRRAEDDTASLTSIGSRTARGPRAMAIKSSPRAVIESRPDSRDGQSPSRHGPKLSIQTVESPKPTSERKSPVRTRPGSIDDSAPSEETLSAAMLEIETLLTTFDWTVPTAGATRLESLLTEELEAVESENVHSLVMNEGPQMQDFVGHLDDGIKQCEELDEMLTLYLVELQALADDVNFIESENRGLHVRTANERALEKELSELLNTMSISPREFEVLKQESLEKQEGIERIEKSLLQVYIALKASAGLVDQQEGEKETMLIVREMRRMTRQESEKFLARLREFVKIKFQAELMTIPSAKSKRPSLPDHSTSYAYFYRYSGFALFAKEVDKDIYNEIRQLYIAPAGRSYKEDFRTFVSQWKTLGRKAEDLELIFSLAKEPQGPVAAVRSATIKRSGTVVKTLRSLDGTREKSDDGKYSVGEVFDEILSVIVPTIIREQSFMMEFLHLSPVAVGKGSFEEFLKSDRTSWMINLEKKRPAELDKSVAKDVFSVMEQLLSWLPDELVNLIEWCRTADALQLVTILGVLEKHINEWDDTDQSFVVRMLNKQHDKLGGLFHRFVEDQVHAIEDMKITAKKRQGVLLMFKIFPGFVDKLELQFHSGILSDGLDVRETVNEAYGRVSRTMFDSLQAIAKDTTSHQASVSKDDDDKEQLNSHISMIENMHFYRDTVDDKGNPVLQDYRKKAQALFDEHLALYLKMVIRRPLGRLVDFLQGVETFVQSNPTEDVTTRISFSKSAFKKVLSHFDTKEIRKGIELLHKRVEKHFGQVPEDTDGVYNARLPAIAKALTLEVWNACQKEYVGTVELCKRILVTYYGDGIQMEFSLNDVNDAFNRRTI